MLWTNMRVRPKNLIMLTYKDKPLLIRSSAMFVWWVPHSSSANAMIVFGNVIATNTCNTTNNSHKSDEISIITSQLSYSISLLAFHFNIPPTVNICLFTWLFHMLGLNPQIKEASSCCVWKEYISHHYLSFDVILTKIYSTTRRVKSIMKMFYIYLSPSLLSHTFYFYFFHT